ncbi:2OG-Fe(II) oxygenase [Isoalcanivorax indicus]|uniref:2OG-Fe(II) oxygenase n=1 Tax=Isoalcanivorax indicus TaxID=2202653 RepID=UPI000DB9BADA|nr:2OG-Fe(II) oxygenase [Isoalcanivorax indicus]
MIPVTPADPHASPVEQLVAGLAGNGYAAIPAFLPPVLVRALRREALLRDRRGEFVEAAIGGPGERQRDASIRGDRTCWLNGTTGPQQRLLSLLEDLRVQINRELFLGLFDLEAHFALYPPGGFYRRHLDAFKGNNARVVSMVLYLNTGWTPEDGGQLRLWPDPETRLHVLDVAPRAGTLVCFLSERIPHEVLPARHDRLSIACWFRRNQPDLPLAVLAP